MIYLIDNQLPVGLVVHLQKLGFEARHVSECGLEQSTDQKIWQYAQQHGCIIVSKDEDFFFLSGTDANGPPLVWVRLGNCRKDALYAAFDKLMTEVAEAIAAGAKVVEIR